MENIFKRLDFVIKESEEMTKHFDQKELEEVTMFCMCMLDRLNFSSESLKVLMNNFLANTKMEYSSGIIIRSVLLDYLIVLNAMDVYGKNLMDGPKLYRELNEFCLMMLCDSVRNTMEYFDSLKGQIPDETLSNMYNNLVAMNSKCFEPYTNDGTRPIIRTKVYKSPKQMFNTLLTSKELSRYKSVYEAYLFYSKYDHFGQMFYGLSRRKPIDQLGNIDKVISIFPRILLFTTVILETLFGGDEFLKTKREAITLFIDEIEGIK
jgi:hypothetical protein